jgi:membrane-bound lytic murein transglycosylase A
VAGGGGAEGLFTGYFEPELRGARREGDGFRIPLYRPPPDLAGETP